MRKIELVKTMVEVQGVSQRQACKALGLARVLLCYRPVERDENAVIASAPRVPPSPRSFRLLQEPWGESVLWRLYCKLKLNSRRPGTASLDKRGCSADFIAEADAL